MKAALVVLLLTQLFCDSFLHVFLLFVTHLYPVNRYKILLTPVQIQRHNTTHTERNESIHTDTLLLFLLTESASEGDNLIDMQSLEDAEKKISIFRSCLLE